MKKNRKETHRRPASALHARRRSAGRAVLVLHGLATMALGGCGAEADGEYLDGELVDESELAAADLKDTIWKCEVTCFGDKKTTYTVCAGSEGKAEGASDDAETACKDAGHGTTAGIAPSCSSTGNKC